VFIVEIWKVLKLACNGFELPRSIPLKLDKGLFKLKTINYE